MSAYKVDKLGAVERGKHYRLETIIRNNGYLYDICTVRIKTNAVHAFGCIKTLVYTKSNIYVYFIDICDQDYCKELDKVLTLWPTLCVVMRRLPLSKKLN